MEQFRQRMEAAIEAAPNEQTKRSLQVLLDHCGDGGDVSTLDDSGGHAPTPPKQPGN